MAHAANNARHDSAQPVTSQQVEDAWQAYAATQRVARDHPALCENEYFTAIQDTAYARFLMAFEAMEIVQ